MYLYFQAARFVLIYMVVVVGVDVAMRKTGECTYVNEKNKVMVTPDQFTWHTDRVYGSIVCFFLQYQIVVKQLPQQGKSWIEECAFLSK